MTRGNRVRRWAAALVVLIAIPATAEADQYHYSMTARIRPLLLFWISRSGVGDAFLSRDRTPEHARYSLLIGSDPDRAPRRINRWGYIEEDVRGADARLIGLMTQSDEESLQEADASLRAQPTGRRPFKVIQAQIDGDRAVSRVTTISAPEEYTFRQLAGALELARGSASAGTSRTLRLPPGSRPGFLSAVAEAMSTLSTTPIRYVYHGRVYELQQTRVRRVPSIQVGGVAYGSGASGDFVVTRVDNREETRFSMTYGTAGRFAGVPLIMTYQPRWWMQVELSIDVDRGERHGQTTAEGEGR